MPVRSPLTAAARQCSRRPARHVVVSSIFSPTAFLRFDIPRPDENRNSASTKYITEAESEGAFFSSESAEKNRTGWFGQSVT